MREIKFRGKSKEEVLDDCYPTKVLIAKGEWVYGAYVKNTGRKNGIDTYCELETIEVIPETVGQYINATDIKGNEIYRGDKIKAFIRHQHGSWGIMEIRWSTTFNGFMAYDTETTELWQIINLYGIEVIGNIHDKEEI